MVKQKSSTHLDRDMNAYKMRTPYGGSTNHSQSKPSRHNRVQVAHSNGCCSSKQPETTPSQPVIVEQTQTPRTTAHERSHSRLDYSPDPFYHRHGRIKKNPNRIKQSSQQQYTKNQIHSPRPTTELRQTNRNYQPVQQTTKKKDCCCCTIL